MTFKDLAIVAPILKALEAQGYTTPTPIQEQSIPILLNGKDLLGCAQTGTGKTAAFAIPIIQKLYLENLNSNNKQRKIKALVVTPTRELAIQIADNFKIYAQHTTLKSTVIFGGVKQHSQERALRSGIDILIATPGRLLDLINQGFISLRDVKYSVLDEADQMLDMGFIHDIKKLIALLPKNRQSLFFSATMAPEIVTLSQKILGNPERVTIAPKQTTAEKVEQSVYFVSKSDKTNLLIHLLNENPNDTAIVFSRTKHGADKVVKLLAKADIPSAAIHGNKSQNARQRALKDFKDGKIKVLIATDIAARGIDVSGLSLVINYELPNVPETYVHRIGRTGRANASGVAISFCNGEEKEFLRDIQKLINQKIPVIAEHPFVDQNIEDFTPKPKPNKKKPFRREGNSNNSTPNKNASRSSRPRRRRD